MASTVPYDARLERILTSAAEVFARKGFHSTTMRDLSRATGMSLAGMYHYVEGKDDLLHQVQRRSFERVLDGVEQALKGLTDPEERLRAFIHHHVTFFASHMAEMKVLSHEAESLSGERYVEILTLKRRHVALLEHLVRDLGADERDARIGAYALFGMMNWIYTWYRPDGPVRADALAERFTELFLRGLPAASSSTTEGG